MWDWDFRDSDFGFQVDCKHPTPPKATKDCEALSLGRGNQVMQRFHPSTVELRFTGCGAQGRGFMHCSGLGAWNLSLASAELRLRTPLLVLVQKLV